jgi:hypothetical protein
VKGVSVTPLSQGYPCSTNQVPDANRGDALPQRIRFRAATRAIGQVKRDYLNANLMLPGSSSTYVSLREARHRNGNELRSLPSRRHEQYRLGIID